MVNVVQTGMLWLNKADLTDNQILSIQIAYSYPHPKDPLDVFQTYVETDDRIGVPTGSQSKLRNLIGCFTVEDHSVAPEFKNQDVDSSMLTLRDYQEEALDEILTYFKFSGTTLNLAGNPGCVDCDTEVLTRQGWVKFSEYNSGEILQWSPDGTTEWVEPTALIKEPCDSMIRIKTTTTDMVLSDEHKVPYYTSKGNFAVKQACDLIKLSQVKIPKTFSYPTNGSHIDLSDAEIRVMVMQSADGYLVPNSPRIRINVKRERKKIRLVQLLEAADISYSITKCTEGYLCVTYIPPIKTKDLSMFFGASKEQLAVIAEECIHWDGCVASLSFTGNDANSALIQYALSITHQKVCNISYDTREHKNGRINTVYLSELNNGTLKLQNDGVVTEYKTTDGYKYCVTVPSGFFLARRNGKIFPTGNSGKSFMLAALLTQLKVKVLIIAHLTSLVKQITDEIETATGLKVTVLNAKNKQIGDINVATSQFISRNSDVWYQIKKGVGLLVIDEAESAGSESTLRIVQKCYAKYRIFISATYRRSVDRRTQALLDLAGNKKVTLEYKDLIKPTVLQIDCPEFFNPPANKMMYQRAKSKFFKAWTIHDKVVKITQSSLKKDRQVLIVMDLIDIQEIISERLENLGIKTAIINSETKSADRTEILKQFDAGDIQVLLGFATLNAGLSIPKISTIIKVSMPSNVEKLEQTIGRARRTFKGKEGAWVIDLSFDGFKNQSKFYQTKVQTEGWAFKQLSWSKFEEHLDK